MEKEYSEKDGSKLLRLARQSIQTQLDGSKTDVAGLKKLFSDHIVKNQRGIFVSLHQQGVLRGCIGNIEPSKTVFDGVIENARYAAFKDSRFSPLLYQELEKTKIEVSILTLPEVLEYTDARDLIVKLRPGIDGVIIKKSHHTATFLPQVWKQLQSPEDFLSHLCRKAGLPSQEWRQGELDIRVYQVQSFEEQPGPED